MTDTLYNDNNKDGLAFDPSNDQRRTTKRKSKVRASEYDVPHGLNLARRWTTPGVDPFNQVEWEKRSAVITGEGGRVVFEQKDIEVPASWSQLATNVVVSKYFRGTLGASDR